MTETTETAKRNIIICCDGTGNEISENISNVLKLYRCLRKTARTEPRQLVFYDPGVGTLARPDPWHKLRQDFSAILGLATGYGLDDKVLQAYHFLLHNYREGDQIYLFGFSRGAYTVRVLAGLIHKVGLIAPEQANLAGSGLTSYKQFSSDGQHGPDLTGLTDTAADADGPLPANKDDQAAQFARILSTRWPTIRFVGVWDTVASVIVPRPDRFYWPSLEELAFTLQNPSVQTFRQAISIDERRCMFRLKKWDHMQTYMHNRFSLTNNAEPQDIMQCWFAGVHSDIGGGYPEKQSGLSKYPLIWMIDEAVKCGLKVDQRTVNTLCWGKDRKNSPFHYVKPDFRDQLHNSLHGAWWILEFIPKLAKYKEWPDRKVEFGFYIPDAEPRPIPDGAFVHESVIQRMNDPALNYKPVNFPAQHQVIPMPAGPEAATAEPVKDEV
ncbi:Uncharacterized alpha/beta hydrolase domain [Bradyrhizobium erythrophlei]|jgi:uncharacterized protein (DUF2235 family)|nr:Uncharacterized alpha/beta hydrolase domain [Bradyrhizobium erythrophlei]